MPNRVNFVSHIEDDGWNLPVEIIEEIEYKVTIAREEAMKRARREYRNHKGDFITQEVVDKYQAMVWPYQAMNGYQYTGMVRRIGKELQEKYGVTELEAINILNDHNVEDYLNRYDRIKNMIPEGFDEEEAKWQLREEYLSQMIS